MFIGVRVVTVIFLALPPTQPRRSRHHWAARESRIRYGEKFCHGWKKKASQCCAVLNCRTCSRRHTHQSYGDGQTFTHFVHGFIVALLNTKQFWFRFGFFLPLSLLFGFGVSEGAERAILYTSTSCISAERVAMREERVTSLYYTQYLCNKFGICVFHYMDSGAC